MRQTDMRGLLGLSLEGREIPVYRNFREEKAGAPPGAGPSTLLIGGTHGDERATVTLLEAFVRSHLATGRIREPVAVIPLHNPDGYARDIRYNARGVDLNRNFPMGWSASSEEPSGATPLSEPEARLLHDFILASRPTRIVSLHWALAEIDADGSQSAPLALSMWNALTSEERIPYRLRLDDGSMPPSTPGSLGQWCGHGLKEDYDGFGPAMVTLELPWHPHRHPRPDPLPEGHFQAARRLWAEHPEDYLAGIQGPVLRMLEAACRSAVVPGPHPGLNAA